MSDSITPEKERSEQENGQEIVEVNQEFQLFAPGRTSSKPSHNFPEVSRFFSSPIEQVGPLGVKRK